MDMAARLLIVLFSDHPFRRLLAGLSGQPAGRGGNPPGGDPMKPR
jgi:hypothetical protein